MIERFIERLRGRALKVVFPEGKDPLILAAAYRLKHERIAEPVVLGTLDKMGPAASAAQVSLDELTVINPAESERLEQYVDAYAHARGLESAIAGRIVKRPLYFAGMMVAQGHADSMVAGATCSTAAVISASVLTVGLAEGVETPSSFFLMILPHDREGSSRRLIYADCALNIAPTPAQLADIAVASYHSARSLLDEPPRVAMLSFSSQGDAMHTSVECVREALTIARQKSPGIVIDGEFQADTALVPAVAAKKLNQPGPVAGRANVLVFPDLNSGNIAYKLTEYLAGAEAIGPILQGFKRPISDLSRGATVDDIVQAAVVCQVRHLDATGE
jgi:phosphate acetyltransferase